MKIAITILYFLSLTAMAAMASAQVAHWPSMLVGIAFGAFGCGIVMEGELQ